MSTYPRRKFLAHAAARRRVNRPIENVVIRDRTMKDGHGGVSGSEIWGGARNIFAERCRMHSPQLDRTLRIKTNSVRGGIVEGIYMRDVAGGAGRPGCGNDRLEKADIVEAVKGLTLKNVRRNGQLLDQVR